MEEKRRELFHRLDSNLSDYCEGLLGTDKQELIGMAEQIAARFGVRDYLKARHTFRAPELEFLLRQDDPLDVVAKHTPPIPMLLEMSGAIADLSAIEDALGDPQRRPERTDAMAVVAKAAQNQAGRDALLEGIAREHCHFETLAERKSDSLDFREVSVWGFKAALEAAFEAGMAYQFFKDGPAIEAGLPDKPHAFDAQEAREELSDRLDQNYAEMMNDYRSDISDNQLPSHEVVALAERITCVSDAYKYLGDTELPEDQVAYLIQFQNPLEVVADSWPGTLDGLVDMDTVLEDICDKEDALHDYPLAEVTVLVAERGQPAELRTIPTNSHAISEIVGGSPETPGHSGAIQYYFNGDIDPANYDDALVSRVLPDGAVLGTLVVAARNEASGHLRSLSAEEIRTLRAELDAPRHQPQISATPATSQNGKPSLLAGIAQAQARAAEMGQRPNGHEHTDAQHEPER